MRWAFRTKCVLPISAMNMSVVVMLTFVPYLAPRKPIIATYSYTHKTFCLIKPFLIQLNQYKLISYFIAAPVLSCQQVLHFHFDLFAVAHPALANLSLFWLNFGFPFSLRQLSDFHYKRWQLNHGVVHRLLVLRLHSRAKESKKESFLSKLNESFSCFVFITFHCFHH